MRSPQGYVHTVLENKGVLVDKGVLVNQGVLVKKDYPLKKSDRIGGFYHAGLAYKTGVG